MQEKKISIYVSSYGSFIQCGIQGNYFQEHLKEKQNSEIY